MMHIHTEREKEGKYVTYFHAAVYLSRSCLLRDSQESLQFIEQSLGKCMKKLFEFNFLKFFFCHLQLILMRVTTRKEGHACIISIDLGIVKLGHLLRC